VTTNKHVAAKAGITSAALYHYFDSKLAMYLDVFDDVEAFVDVRFETAIASSDTFVGRFRAVLEAAYEMNRADPSLARFLGSARVDIARHTDLRAAIEDHRRPGQEIVRQLIETGLATGEIPRDRRNQADAFVRTIMVGLNDAVSHDLRQQRAAIDGIVAVVEGTLLEKPAGGKGNGPRVRRRARA
jgi:AcrR family transcriptional regulator